ncbi:hypothetical protein CHELA20_11053 [Hyphomicrobiales bacterium]|nr:hypothetical protein CHELA20_11053 [Hyphomicrobiales bacterium]CAH1694754.1 hypothetical protein CHELA41_51284 [Hyphomicrobiales bacterium]
MQSQPPGTFGVPLAGRNFGGIANEGTYTTKQSLPLDSSRIATGEAGTSATRSPAIGSRNESCP